MEFDRGQPYGLASIRDSIRLDARRAEWVVMANLRRAEMAHQDIIQHTGIEGSAAGGAATLKRTWERLVCLPLTGGGGNGRPAARQAWPSGGLSIRGGYVRSFGRLAISGYVWRSLLSKVASESCSR